MIRTPLHSVEHYTNELSSYCCSIMQLCCVPLSICLSHRWSIELSVVFPWAVVHHTSVMLPSLSEQAAAVCSPLQMQWQFIKKIQAGRCHLCATLGVERVDPLSSRFIAVFIHFCKLTLLHIVLFHCTFL